MDYNEIERARNSVEHNFFAYGSAPNDDKARETLAHNFFHLTAMAWQDWYGKVRGECSDCGPGAEGRYVIPQAGAFLNYQHAINNKGEPELKVIGIYTHPDNRNDGVAEALVRRLHDAHPDIPINPGVMTNDGQHFHDRMLDKEPDAKGYVTASCDCFQERP